MVRKSIRVVLVAENDLLEVAGDPAAGDEAAEVKGDEGGGVKKSQENQSKLRSKKTKLYHHGISWRCISV